jgi:predicted AAA+ superfamily ATPase
MNQQSTNVVRAMLQGITGAGLFRRLNYPGAPAHFVDPRSLDEILAIVEVDETCQIYTEAKYAKARNDARQRSEAEAAKTVRVR